MGKYEEALERAKQGMPIDEVFPELKESEEEKIRKFLIDILSSGTWRKEWPFSPADCVAYLEKQKEQKPAEQLGGTFTSYDMAKTFTEGQNYVIAHPEKFGLCKPAEWSEEDERMLEPFISDLRELCNCETDEELISDYEDRIAWLKSLRPQPHWKPSEEHFQALRRAIKKADVNSDTEHWLSDLYNDLKSL